MRHLLGLIVSLGVAMTLVVSALAASKAQLNGVIVKVAPPEKKGEVVNKEIKTDPAKQPAIKFKVFEKAEVKKEEAQKGAMKKARVQVIEKMVVQRQVAPGEPHPP